METKYFCVFPDVLIATLGLSFPNYSTLHYNDVMHFANILTAINTPGITLEVYCSPVLCLSSCLEMHTYPREQEFIIPYEYECQLRISKLSPELLNILRIGIEQLKKECWSKNGYDPRGK